MTTETKRIDPKRIKEWERLAAVVAESIRVASERYPGYDDATLRDLSSAVPALLSEREEMKREIEALEGDLSLADGRVETIEELSRDNARLRSERESLLSLLREVEWGGKTMPVPDAAGDEWPCPMCPVCGRAPIQGHAPDCRLASFLKET